MSAPNLRLIGDETPAPLKISRLPRTDARALEDYVCSARDLIASVAQDLDGQGHEDSRLTAAGELLAEVLSALR